MKCNLFKVSEFSGKNFCHFYQKMLSDSDEIPTLTHFHVTITDERSKRKKTLRNKIQFATEFVLCFDKKTNSQRNQFSYYTKGAVIYLLGLFCSSRDPRVPVNFVTT